MRRRRPGPLGPRPTVTVSLRLDPDVFERLKKLCEARGYFQVRVIEAALEKYLDDAEGKP